MFPRPFAFRIFHHQLPKCSPFRSQYPNSTWRYFTSSAPRRAAKPAQSSAADEAALRFAGRRPEGLGQLERKVAKEGNVLLFQAPSHTGYRFGAYCLSGFCFAYAAYNSNAIFRNSSSPLPRWMQACVGTVSILMGVMGTVILLRTARLVKTINAFWSNGQTHVRFTVRSMIPSRKVVIDVEPRQIAVARRLVVSPESMTAVQSAEMEHTSQASKPSFFRNPAKGISIAFWHLFRTIRQLFTEEDFINLKLQGHSGDFRMDSNGFVSQHFLSIGSLVTYTR
ncbi:hypothetical protein PHISP_04785 [Aspergillus sp. HF37]|nr:hypothetical protein PHISP_04785 [Aspergillus sp. HF37]